MREIVKRLKSKTPTFFKDLIKISLLISFISGALLTSGLVFPDSIVGWISKAGILAGLVSAIVSKLTTVYGISEYEKPELESFADAPDTVNPDTKPNPGTKNP